MARPTDPSLRKVARVVAICNLKGGTGKSTLSVNLACAFAALGGEVMIVDGDEQGSSAAWAATRRLPARCVHLPLSRPEDLAGWIGQLQDLRVGRSVVVVDFPATVDLALGATLMLASAVLIPCGPSGIEVAATRRMMRYVARLREERSDDPPVVLVVPNRVGDPRAEDFDVLRRSLAALGEELAPPISAGSEYARAFDRGTWVGDDSPGSPAHREILTLANLVCDRFESPPALPLAPARASRRYRARTSSSLAGWATRLMAAPGQPRRYGAPS